MPTTLDELMPRRDHQEVHRKWMRAQPERVWDALCDLRVSDLEVTAALSRLRGGPRAWVRDPAEYAGMAVMDAMAPRLLISQRPEVLVLVDVARYTAARPARPARPEKEAWTPDEFADFAEPGWTKVAMDFELTERDGGTEVSTRTCVASTDPRTRRAFALYWTAVRLGSGMVRRDILRAVSKAVG